MPYTDRTGRPVSRKGDTPVNVLTVYTHINSEGTLRNSLSAFAEPGEVLFDWSTVSWREEDREGDNGGREGSDRDREGPADRESEAPPAQARERSTFLIGPCDPEGVVCQHLSSPPGAQVYIIVIMNPEER